MRQPQRTFRLVLVVIAVATAAPLPAASETVYTWVDAAGVRHFSQYPPEDTDKPVKHIELDTLPPAAADSQDRLERVREVARDLEVARQQREQLRARVEPSQAAPSRPTELPRGSPYMPYPYAHPYPYPYPYAVPAPRPPRPPRRGPHDDSGRPPEPERPLSRARPVP